MKKKKGLIIILLLLMLLSGAGIVGYFKVYLPSIATLELRIVDQNENLIDTVEAQVGSKIELVDYDNKVIKEYLIEEDQVELTIENGTDTDDKLFIEYKVSNSTDETAKKLGYILNPIYENTKDYLLHVSVSEHAKLKRNGKEDSVFKIPVENEQVIEDTLPEVSIDADYKGNWRYLATNEIVELTDVFTDNTELIFVTYQDKNDNFIDDFAEIFTVEFVTYLNEGVESREVTWEQTVSLPKLKDDNNVFYEWYSNPEKTELFTEQTKITDNIILHANVKSIEQVMNESVENPIERMDIVLQVERILSDRNKQVDETYNQTIQQENRAREERDRFERENNVVNTNRKYTIEFSNTALNKLYFVSFIDENNNFIYGFVSPYGRTIKIYNTDGNIWKEYAIRQNTTIKLDSKALTAYNHQLQGYSSEYYKINNTIYVKISPDVIERTQEKYSQE